MEGSWQLIQALDPAVQVLGVVLLIYVGMELRDAYLERQGPSAWMGVFIVGYCLVMAVDVVSKSI